MATVLKARRDGNLLLVHEDINEFMSIKQKFNVINGGWTGIFENGAFTYAYCDDSENEVIEVIVYRHVEYDADNDPDCEKTLRPFAKQSRIRSKPNHALAKAVFGE